MRGQGLGELVKKAKGNDRTAKEYAAAAGIDPAVVSKMISGKYVPQKEGVYEKLTSRDAQPRGGVTKEEMMKAAHFSASYQAGMMAAKTVLATIGGLPLVASMETLKYVKAIKEESEVIEEKIAIDKDLAQNSSERIKEYDRKLKIFSAISTGVIYGELAKRRIGFQVEEDERFIYNEVDKMLRIEGNTYNTWVIKYCFSEDGESEVNVLAKRTGIHAISSLLFLPRDSKRKVSIVVNNKEIYEYMIELLNDNSYAGNLSIIQIDADNVRIVKETYVAGGRGEDNGMYGDVLNMNSDIR